MLEFVIFAVTFVIVLLISVIYLYPGGSKSTTIPGLDPSEPDDGNLGDIVKCGSLQEFLTDIHEAYGDITSFWMGHKLVVSLGSVELLQQHSNVFDRPASLFSLYEPLYGDSVFFKNGTEGRKLHSLYTKAYSEQGLETAVNIFHKNTEDVTKRWTSLPKEEHVAVTAYMQALNLKALVQASFGQFFNDDKAVFQLRKNLDTCLSEMEALMKVDALPLRSEMRKKFDRARADVAAQLQSAVEVRRKSDKKDSLLIDALIASGQSDTLIVNDALTFLAIGFHSLSVCVTWALYYIASDDKVQDKVHKELDSVCKDGLITVDHIRKLKYLQQVMNETLRCSLLQPWTARVQDLEIELGGHKIPSGTPIIQALGVAIRNSPTWTKGDSFDPDNFSEEKVESRPKHAFEPFGFAGRRGCPARQLSHDATSVIAATLLRKFKLLLVEGQVVMPEYGLVTKPKDEIWITVEKRK